MLIEGFAESWVNSKHRVLGFDLLPFALWHRFQLQLLESPILEGKVVLPADLYQACRACQLVYPETIKGKINMWSLRWRIAGNFKMEVQKFGEYLSDHFAPPQFLPPVRNYHRTEVLHPPPEEMRIFSAVVALTGWSEEKIWMLPIGQAYWYAAGHWYQSGQELDFLTPEHLILKKRIDAMKAGTNG